MGAVDLVTVRAVGTPGRGRRRSRLPGWRRGGGSRTGRGAGLTRPSGRPATRAAGRAGLAVLTELTLRGRGGPRTPRACTSADEAWGSRSARSPAMELERLPGRDPPPDGGDRAPARRRGARAGRGVRRGRALRARARVLRRRQTRRRPRRTRWGTSSWRSRSSATATTSRSRPVRDGGARKAGAKAPEWRAQLGDRLARPAGAHGRLTDRAPAISAERHQGDARDGECRRGPRAPVVPLAEERHGERDQADGGEGVKCRRHARVLRPRDRPPGSSRCRGRWR